MEVVYSRCAGLDVHKKLIVACARVIDGGRIIRMKERFGTTTGELKRLAAWMTEHQVTHAAMESTGVYWKNHEGEPSPTLDVSGTLSPSVRARP